MVEIIVVIVRSVKDITELTILPVQFKYKETRSSMGAHECSRVRSGITRIHIDHITSHILINVLLNGGFDMKIIHLKENYGLSN